MSTSHDPRPTTLALIFAALVGSVSISVHATEVARMPDGRVAFVNGGISEEEADRMRAEAARFPLAIVFGDASQRDEPNAFAADVNLRVTDAQGRMVLQHAAAGPILLANLPAGSYTIEAEYQGKVKRQHATIVEGQHQRVGFVWP